MTYGKQWTTCVGTFADSCGIVQWITDEVTRDSRGQVASVTRHTESAIEPASKYASFQPSSIPILWRHKGAPIGRCVLLDRSSNLLSAVAVLQESASFYTDGMPELFWSSGATDDGQLTIKELSLTPSPATNGLAPVRFFDGLPSEAKGQQYAPWSTFNRADEVLKGVYDPMEVRCRFDDFDNPRRPVGESRGRIHRNGEEMELIYRPARVVAVNGRPVNGPW